MQHRPARNYRGLCQLILPVILLLVSCQGSDRPACPTPVPETGGGSLQLDQRLATATPRTPDSIRSVWSSGNHANTYIAREEDGNETCARCHSPLNWRGSAKDISDGEAGSLSQSVSIPASEWKHVGCAVCHPGDANEIEGVVAWLDDPAQGTYDESLTASELCEKCHRSEQANGHVPTMLMGTHEDFVCTDCHDPHEGSASCTDAGCHAPFAAECEEIQTHDKPHAEVSCSACHDGAGWEIAWNEMDGVWDTTLPAAEGYRDEPRPYTSHNLILEVDCDRCHAPGNHPWGY